MERERLPRQVRRVRAFRAGTMLLVALLAQCVDELPVDVRVGDDVQIFVDGIDPLAVVGQTDTVELTVTINDLGLTGLRVRWQAYDSTTVQVRSLADLEQLPSTAVLADTLDATLRAELTYLQRGTHEIQVQVDSAGFEGVQQEDIEVTVGERWQSVSAGSTHTCAVTFGNTGEHAVRRGGEAFCWGFSPFGGLGNGRPFLHAIPTKVNADVTFDEVQAGGGATCGLDESLLLHCWGDNSSGQLGLGNHLDQFVPRLIALGESIGDFDLGMDSQFTCALRATAADATARVLGTVLCWGENERGELGCEPAFDCDPDGMNQPETQGVWGTVVYSDESELPPHFTQISLGSSHACGVGAIVPGTEDHENLRPDGTVWCWGDNSTGALGIPIDAFEAFSRVAVAPDVGALFSAVAAGGGFSCGTEIGSNTVHCWGESLEGVGPTAGIVTGLPPGPLTSLVAGTAHACALTSDGSAYCWGDNSEGQLGNGTATDAPTTAVAVHGGLEFSVISAGEAHTCGVAVEPLQIDPLPATYRTSGAIYCWGNDELGQLGNGFTAEDTSVPVRVLEPGTL